MRLLHCKTSSGNHFDLELARFVSTRGSVAVEKILLHKTYWIIFWVNENIDINNSSVIKPYLYFYKQLLQNMILFVWIFRNIWSILKNIKYALKWKRFVRFKAYTRILELSIVCGFINNVMIVLWSFLQYFYE